jgi:hypothetical protein
MTNAVGFFNEGCVMFMSPHNRLQRVAMLLGQSASLIGMLRLLVSTIIVRGSSKKAFLHPQLVHGSISLHALYSSDHNS